MTTTCRNEFHEEWEMAECQLSGTTRCAGCDQPDCPGQGCEERREDAYQRQEERSQS